jgi:transposase InsO family protein
MRDQGITGTPPKVFKVTTDSNHDYGVADNVLEREFDQQAPDTVWATDITYVIQTAAANTRVMITADSCAKRASSAV